MLDFLSLPKRPEKPRSTGITHVIDRGIGLRQAQDMLETSASFIDFVKLGWGNGYVTANLADKIKMYQEFGVSVYFGGTLFEIAVSQGKFENFRKMLESLGISHVEVSNGIIELDIQEKTRYISELAWDFVVLSEVGSKDSNKILPPHLWMEMIQADFNAGAWKVIIEARESGTGGIDQSNGSLRSELIDEIFAQIDFNNLIFEAPKWLQQVCLIKKLGHLVNLGNIATDDVISLETLRLGLQNDTVNFFSPRDAAV